MSNWIYIMGGAVMLLTLVLILFAGNKKKAPFDARKQQRSLDALPDVYIAGQIPSGAVLTMPPVKKPKTKKRMVRRDEMIEHMRKLQKQKTERGPLMRPPPPPNPPRPPSSLIPGAKIMIDDIKDEIHNAMSEVKDELKTVKKDLNKMVKDFDRDFYFAGSPGVRIRDPKIAAQLKYQKLAREQAEFKERVESATGEAIFKALELEVKKQGRRGTSDPGPY